MEKLSINKTLLPKLRQTISVTGEQLKLARLRRRLSQQQIADRAGISLSTLQQIERGSPSVSFGAYAQTLFVLRMEDDLLLLAKDDELGRKIQDLGLVEKKRAPKQQPTNHEPKTKRNF